MPIKKIGLKSELLLLGCLVTIVAWEDNVAGGYMIHRL
jgi:hypothetical protein